MVSQVTVTPDRYVAEAVVEALRGKTQAKRVLLVRAKVARDVLPTELRKSGAKVDVAEAYETHVPKGAKAKLNRLFSNDTSRPDIVTFTSSSTATNFWHCWKKTIGTDCAKFGSRHRTRYQRHAAASRI